MIVGEGRWVTGAFVLNFLILKNHRKFICFQLFLALSLFVTTLKARIIEISDITQIVPYIDKETLVLFDIDNTLIQLPQTLGTPEWFSDFYKKKLAVGISSEQALREVVTDYVQINKSSGAIPVESKTAVIIKKLQEQDIPVLGLTSRDDALSKTTFRQLKLVAINFNMRKFKQYLIKLRIGEKAKLQNGIIFTGGKHKGGCLEEFLTTARFVPKKIVFVDDQLKALQEVKSVISKTNIDYIGVRYGYLDYKARAFNPKISEAQLNHFRKTGKLLSDNDALATLTYKEN